MMLTPEMRRIELLSCATRYIASGIHLLPCGPDKKPLTKTGFKAATTDLATIKRWLKNFPFCMFAARTGEISGIFVVDLDCDLIKGLDGVRQFAQLQQQFGPLPA